MVALSNASRDMLNLNSFESILDTAFHIEPFVIHQVIEPFLTEHGLHFAKNSFNRIELRGVSHIEDESNI